MITIKAMQTNAQASIDSPKPIHYNNNKGFKFGYYRSLKNKKGLISRPNK
jgi:hypothetical protein